MSQSPTPYERQDNFVSDATNNPSITVPQIATGLDAEFLAVRTSLNSAINRLGELQRDDGALRDAIVSAQSLSPSVLSLLALNGVVVRGVWTAAVSYAAGDVVSANNGTYFCALSHTANADFSVDQVAGRWLTLEAPFNNSVTTQRFTANGSQTVFSLGVTGTVNVTNTFINGVYQNKDTYGVNGSTLTFGEAPPSGAIVEIIVGAITPVTAVVPDLSVSTAKIADAAITTAKIASGAVITADLADGAVTNAKVAVGAITPAKLSTGAPTWDTSGDVYANGNNPQFLAMPTANGIGFFLSSAKNALGAIVGQLQMYSAQYAAVINQIANLPMLFMTNNTERMRITADGNVGIGTSSPTQKLDVAGNQRLRYSAGTGAVIFYDTAGTSGRFAVGSDVVSESFRIYDQVAGSQRLAIEANGNINTQGNPITNCPTTAKAWVRIFPTNPANVTGTYTQTGATVTVTSASPTGVQVGQTVYLNITSGTGVGGQYMVVSVISPTVFTYTAGTSLTTSGNVTLNFAAAAGYNVSSVSKFGNGSYAINFSTPCANGNLAVSAIMETTTASPIVRCLGAAANFVNIQTHDSNTLTDSTASTMVTIFGN